MVEVFKTNVEQSMKSEWLISQLIRQVPNGKISFDLEDCDKILRIEAESISIQSIIEFVKQNGFHAEVLI